MLNKEFQYTAIAKPCKSQLIWFRLNVWWNIRTEIYIDTLILPWLCYLNYLNMYLKARNNRILNKGAVTSTIAAGDPKEK